MATPQMKSMILMPDPALRTHILAVPSEFDLGYNPNPFIKEYVSRLVPLYQIAYTKTEILHYMDSDRTNFKTPLALVVFIHKNDLPLFDSYGNQALEYCFHEILMEIKSRDPKKFCWGPGGGRKNVWNLPKEILNDGARSFRLNELRYWCKIAGTPFKVSGRNRVLEIREQVFEALLDEFPDIQDLIQSHYIEEYFKAKQEEFVKPTGFIAIQPKPPMVDMLEELLSIPIKMEPLPEKEKDNMATLIERLFDEDYDDIFSSDDSEAEECCDSPEGNNENEDLRLTKESAKLDQEEEIIIIESLDAANKEVERKEEKKAHKINQDPDIIEFHRKTGFLDYQQKMAKEKEEEEERAPFVYTDKTGKDWSSADPYPPGYEPPEKFMGLTGRRGQVPTIKKENKPLLPIVKQTVKLPEKPMNFFERKRLRRLSESFSQNRAVTNQ